MQNNTDDFLYDKSLPFRILEYEKRRKEGKKIYLDVEEYLDIIIYYVEKNQLAKAFSACSSALAIHPESSELKIKKAQLLIEKKDAHSALHWLKKAPDLEEDADYILTKGLAQLQLNKIEDSIANFDKVIVEEDVMEDLEELFTIIANALIEEELFEIALRYLSKAHKKFPRNLHFIFQIAFCYEELEQLEKGIEFYQKFLQKDSFSIMAWTNLSNLYLKSKNYEKAIEACEYAYALNNENNYLLLNLAYIKLDTQMYDGAISDLKKYLALNPESHSAIYYIGECLYEKEEYQKAKRHFKNAIAQFTEVPDFYHGLGMVYLRQNKYRRAISAFLKSLKVDSNYTDSLYFLGNIFARKRNWKRAINYYQQIFRIDKNDIEAILSCVDAFFNSNQMDKMQEMLQDAIHRFPDKAILVFAKAAYLFLENKTSEGIKYFKKAFSIDPEESQITFEIFPEAIQIKEIKEILKLNNKTINRRISDDRE